MIVGKGGEEGLTFEDKTIAAALDRIGDGSKTGKYLL